MLRQVADRIRAGAHQLAEAQARDRAVCEHGAGRIGAASYRCDAHERQRRAGLPHVAPPPSAVGQENEEDRRQRDEQRQDDRDPEDRLVDVLTRRHQLLARVVTQRIRHVLEELGQDRDPARDAGPKRRDPVVEGHARVLDPVGDHLQAHHRLVDEPAQVRPDDRPAEHDRVGQHAQKSRPGPVGIDLEHHVPRTISHQPENRAQTKI